MFSPITSLFSKPSATPTPLYQELNGVMMFNTNKLNAAQCEVVHGTCRKEAYSQRMQAIVKSAFVAIAATAIVLTAIVAAKIAAPFFVIGAMKLAVLANIHLHELAPLALKMFAKGSIYLSGVVGLTILLNRAVESIGHHLNYATYLDREALKASLHRAGQLVYMAQDK